MRRNIIENRVDVSKDNPSTIEQSNEIINKIDTVVSINSSSSEKNVEFNVNENDDTIAIEEQIKETIIEDNSNRLNDAKNTNLLDQLNLNSIQFFSHSQRKVSNMFDDENKRESNFKDMLPELDNISNNKNNLKIKGSYRENSTTRTNELLSTITDKPFTSSNRHKTKFHNYSQIKTYLDESKLNDSLFQPEPITLKNSQLDYEINLKNKNSYTHLNGDTNIYEEGYNKSYNVGQKTNYEKICNNSIMLNISKEIQKEDDNEFYYQKKDLDSVKKNSQFDGKTDKSCLKKKYKIGLMVLIIIILLSVGGILFYLFKFY